MAEDLDTTRIKNWRSIITLIVFVLTSEFGIEPILPRLKLTLFASTLRRCCRAFPVSCPDLHPAMAIQLDMGWPECRAHHTPSRGSPSR